MTNLEPYSVAGNDGDADFYGYAVSFRSDQSQFSMNLATVWWPTSTNGVEFHQVRMVTRFVSDAVDVQIEDWMPLGVILCIKDCLIRSLNEGGSFSLLQGEDLSDGHLKVRGRLSSEIGYNKQDFRLSACLAIGDSSIVSHRNLLELHIDGASDSTALTFSMRVSRDDLQRNLRVLEAFVRECESCGINVSWWSN